MRRVTVLGRYLRYLRYLLPELLVQIQRSRIKGTY
uniref:Uncharacterized protein n=1 Tax=Arundo donax TaxID=35708 RepID=A0A0A9UE20_ARUDO